MSQIRVNGPKLFGLIADGDYKSEREFCVKAGIAPQVLRRILEHGGPVQLPTLSRIAKTLDVSAVELLLPARAAESDASEQHSEPNGSENRNRTPRVTVISAAKGWRRS